MVSIAPLSAADRDDWLPLWRGYLDFYEAELDDAVTAATFARLVDPAGGIYGALARADDGAPLGLVHWLCHPATWATADYCYLEDLYVAPAARGMGAGASLIEHVRAWAEQNDAAKVYWLTAETNSRARALYDRVSTRTGMIHYQIKTS